LRQLSRQLGIRILNVTRSVLELQPQGEEMLLGAVVKVPLDLATLGVAGGGNACTGSLQLFDCRSELRLKQTALEGEDQCLPGGAHELGVAAQ
jgi:hypothetical protein